MWCISGLLGIDLMVKCEWSESEFVAGKNMYGLALLFTKILTKLLDAKGYFFSNC